MKIKELIEDQEVLQEKLSQNSSFCNLSFQKDLDFFDVFVKIIFQD